MLLRGKLDGPRVPGLGVELPPGLLAQRLPAVPELHLLAFAPGGLPTDPHDHDARDPQAQGNQPRLPARMAGNVTGGTQLVKILPAQERDDHHRTSDEEPAGQPADDRDAPVAA